MRKWILSFIIVVLAISSVGAGEFRFTDDVQKVQLSNGITVLIKENPAFDIVSMVLLSNVGSIHDPVDKAGLTSLTQESIMKGTRYLNQQDLALALESQGVHMAAQTSYEMAALVFQSTTDRFASGIQLFWDVLKYPSFPESEVEWAQQLAYYNVLSLMDQPTNEVVLAFLEEFYGETGYSRSPLGSLETIPNLTRDDVVEWYSVIYQPQNLVMAIVGNVDTAEVVDLLEREIGQWQPSAPSNRLTPNTVEFASPTQSSQRLMNKPTQAAWMILGFPAPSAMEEDGASMAVLNAVLGGGMGSRLFTEVRDERGLAYIIMSEYAPNYGPSHILAFLGTHPSTVDEARRQVLEQFYRFIQEELSDEDLQRAITLVRGQYLMESETNLSQAVVLASNELLGPGYEWADQYPQLISGVTKMDVQKAAEKYFGAYIEALLLP